MATETRNGQFVRTMEPEERFWAKVDKSGECWLWTGSKNSWGYGTFRMDGKTLRTHRTAYEFSVGPIPSGMSVLHRCDNPLCVRPDHLFLGTHNDNMADMVRKFRIRQGEAHFRARLDAERVVALRAAYEAGGETYASLGRRFGIGASWVSEIIKGNGWKSVSKGVR